MPGEQTTSIDGRLQMAGSCSIRVGESKKFARTGFTSLTLEAMVAAFVARGGRIHKVPEAVPTTADDVLQYLQGRNVKVEPAPAKPGEVERRYFYDGDIIDLRNLIDRANALRRRQRLPAFEVKLRSRRGSRD
jgi:hypothetical protein